MSPTKQDRLIRQMIEITKVIRNLMLAVIIILTLTVVGNAIIAI